MAAFTELPPILSGDTQQQVRALRDYLVRLVQELPDAADTVQIERAVQKAVGAGSADTQTAAAQAAHGQARALRSLIVKTADEIYRSIDTLETGLSSVYLARSDFGDYAETIDTRIVQTARETVESYNYAAQIDANAARTEGLLQELTDLEGQIRRGLITDPETGEEALGIAISQNLRYTGKTRTESGLLYYELTPGQTLGLYTSTGWQFWINGSKRGWFDSSDGMLHVAQIAVESRLKLGSGWTVTTGGGFGLRYIG